MATSYISRNQALKKLQLSLPDFRYYENLLYLIVIMHYYTQRDGHPHKLQQVIFVPRPSNWIHFLDCVLDLCGLAEGGLGTRPVTVFEMSACDS